jgi:hypothetical protein
VKITVITDDAGNVLATAPYSSGEEEPVHRMTPAPGQKTYEIEVPAELLQTESADAFHQALAEHLAQST